MGKQSTKFASWNIPSLHSSALLGSLCWTTKAMTTGTTLKELSRAASKFFAIIPSRSIRQLLAILFFWSWIVKTVSKFRKRTRKSLSCVCVLHKTWNFTSWSCSDGNEMYKKVWCRWRVFFFGQSKPVAFLKISLTSTSSLVKVPIYSYPFICVIVIIQMKTTLQNTPMVLLMILLLSYR